MKISRIIAVAFVFIICSMTYAQVSGTDTAAMPEDENCATETIQSAIDAFLLLAESVEVEDTVGIQKARDAMEKCNLADFVSLRRKNRDYDESLNGHVVFSVAFADSILEGKDAYSQADSISRLTSNRGQVKPGHILTKTCLVKANGKSVYTFYSSDRQELSVVAEAGGLITIRVHAVNADMKIDEWHNDTSNVAKGLSYRKAAFNLPQAPKTLVTLEIINCTGKDISVVVISN